LRYEDQNLVNAGEREALENREDVMRMREQALQDLVEADPSNWLALNMLAHFQVKHDRLKEAKATFEQIGTHWVSTVWNKASFDKAKEKAI
jgi:predicted Zn-dependent protease